MKKTVCFGFLLAVCILLSGCGDVLPQPTVSADDLLAAIENSQEALPPARLLGADALTPDFLGRLYCKRFIL